MENQENPKTTPIKIAITLPTTAYFLSGIRDFTLNLTKNLTGFSEQWAYRFQSMVDELCNNAIEHGSKKGEEVKLTFISVQNESLEIVVEDTGTGPQRYTGEDMRHLLQEKRETMAHVQYMELRGRGLAQIVASWSDEIEFTNNATGGLVVRVKKYLKEVKDNPVKTLTVNTVPFPLNV